MVRALLRQFKELSPIKKGIAMIHEPELLQHRDALTSTDPDGQRPEDAACHTYFEALVMSHLPGLLRLARKLTHEETLAQDLLQETLLRAYRFVHRFEPGTNFRAWLATIMRHLYVDQQRKQPRETSLDMVHETVASGASTAVEVPEVTHVEIMAALTYFVTDDVLQALQALPEDCRTTVLLADVLEYSYKDIALIMDCPLGTVMSRLHRGRQKLRARLQPYAMAQGYAQPVSAAGTFSLDLKSPPQASGFSRHNGVDFVCIPSL
jgi:RNA polymerase sigma-70 factor (ECF subfamily)